MVRAVKVGGIILGLAAVVGLGVGAWFYTQKPESVPETQSNQRSADTDTTESTNTKPIATVPAGSDTSSNPAVSGQTGLSQTTQGNGTINNQPSRSNTSSANQLPGPADFEQYDQYKNNPSAMYIDVKVGTGAAVAMNSKVTVNYRGWLTDGTKFDESYASGKPFMFTEGAGGVIRGWEEGVFGMKAGGQRRVVVPPAVGYGAAGMGPIPPNALLVFDIELLSVQ